MYMRGVKTTCTNEVMRDSVKCFYLEKFDIMDAGSALMISYKVDLSDNQFMHVGVFADKQTADSFAEQVMPIHKQVQEMGAKMEIIHGDITHFKIAGGVTLDQLTRRC